MYFCWLTNFVYKTMEKKLNYDFIRGFLEGRGCFTFHTIGSKYGLKNKIPAFVIGLSADDKDLLIMIKNSLGLRNKIYEYAQRNRKDGYKRQGSVMLVVRDIGQLKNIIVPLFYGRLVGNKKIQFENWIDKIGEDRMISPGYKFIHTIYKSGFYGKNQKF